jgi:hypothetical protein
MTDITKPPLAVDAEQFAALCNLFHSLCCDRLDLTAEQAGDVLLYGANRVVCDESRLMARVVMAYLGISHAPYRPDHECAYAEDGDDAKCTRCGKFRWAARWHAASDPNIAVAAVLAQMRAGEGSLTDPELEALLEGGTE